MALLNKTSLFLLQHNYRIAFDFAINSSSIFSLEIDIISKPKTSTVFAILSNTSLYLKFSKENAIIEIEKIEIIHKTNPIILNLLGS
jgi:hypothetical protein